MTSSVGVVRFEYVIKYTSCQVSIKTGNFSTFFELLALETIVPNIDSTKTGRFICDVLVNIFFYVLCR